jgi:protein-disulfide isomerase
MIVRAAIAVMLAGVIALAGCVTPVAQTASPPLPSYGFTLAEGAANHTILVFEDFQCPHCRTFEMEGPHAALSQRWIVPGNFSIELIPVAFIGEDSVHAARVVMCVSDQTSEWSSFHHGVFSVQQRPNSGWASEPNMVQLAVAYGADADRLDACLRGTDVDAALNDNLNRMSLSGLTSTPGVIVDGEAFNGNDVGAINAALAGWEQRLRAAA